jgi:methyl-accepting chemotaxis protein
MAFFRVDGGGRRSVRPVKALPAAGRHPGRKNMSRPAPSRPSAGGVGINLDDKDDDFERF